MRGRVESLLRSHDPDGSFLGTPAAVVPDPGHAATLTFEPDAELADTRTSDGTGDTDDEVPLGFLAPSTRPDSLGRIGHYEVLQVLGQGGFGIVFRAFDEVLHRIVAVKVLAPQMASTSPARKRFLREARSSAQVRHENVVQVYEVGEQPLPYIAMEFIPGETLQQRLNRIGPVDVAEVIRIGRQIAEGLAAAHATDLIHRDIKPGNILLEGGAGRVKITDFGLARAADDASISQSGIIAGTPMYMAPEQAKGETLDQRADLFSLGSVLYVMAAGRPPFRANSTVAVLKRVAEDTPRDIREIVPETPQWLSDIIAKLHAKNPDERYQSAREMADVLADCETQLKANAKLKDFSRIPKSKQPAAGKSGRWKWVAAAVLLLPVLALAVTELAGVTQLFRGKHVVLVPTTLGTEPTSPIVIDGWVQLFNGRDLTGWNSVPQSPGDWKVENGVLIGRGPDQAYLFSDRGDYRDFHLRAEARINAEGNSGIHFHVTKPLVRFKGAPNGYEAQIAGTRGDQNCTGSLFKYPGQDWLLSQVKAPSAPDDTWFVFEIIARGNRIITRVNDKTLVDLENGGPETGHFALQVFENNVVVQFRKIEIKELPPSSLPPTYKNNVGMEFVIVPKGKSWLGGGKDKMGDKEVEIPADFYLGKYEVTQEEWEKVMGENPSHFSRTGAGKDAVKDIPDADLKRFPVENVSWDQCQLLVAKLNEREKEKGWVYRLPTEVEWEYACRCGPMADKLDSAFDFYFAEPTHALLPQQANFNAGLNRTTQVGSYEPNRLGLFDMHGNVTEYCDDVEKVDDGALHHAVRSGNWTTNSDICKATWRVLNPPFNRNLLVGLRLARVRPDPDRLAAEYVLSMGGAVRVNGNYNNIKAVADLPAGAFKINYAGELGNKPVTDAGLAVFKDCTDLVKVDLFSCKQVTDAGVAHLQGRTNLLYLNLSDTQVTDAGLAGFKDCKAMDFLVLDGTQVTDAGLAVFKDCKSLTWVQLNNMPRVTDAGLAHFKDCMKLTKLRIQGTPVGDAGLASLKDVPLEDIRLTPRIFTPQGLAVLREMKSLKTIGIGEASNQTWPAAEFWDRYDKGEFAVAAFTDADVKRITALPAAEQVEEVRKELMRRNPGFDGKVEHKIEDGVVTELRIITDKVTDIAPIRVFNALRVLDLYGTELDGQGNGQLADLAPLKEMNLSSLTYLSVARTKIGDDGLVYFINCKNLTGLKLNQTWVTNAGMANFEGCKKLQSLDLKYTKVEDAGLAHFKGCKDLNGVDFGGLNMTDEGLAHFKDCKGLTHLLLHETRVSDAGLANFKDCKGLTFLHLSWTSVGDAGLAHFKDCKNLAMLELRGTRITDLSLLKGWPLKVIYCDFQPERDAEILRSIKTLETINGKPAAEFWKDAEKK
ncbi:hypothetical protein BH11PLA2_BH11PLA2_47090 [soil metagenome]